MPENSRIPTNLTKFTEVRATNHSAWPFPIITMKLSVSLPGQHDLSNSMIQLPTKEQSEIIGEASFKIRPDLFPAESFR
ncbi:hypothetical protein QG37_03227 [Candidozyma auris]|nr:hypothetical protein QG37_03227 [[Candida] auris]